MTKKLKLSTAIRGKASWAVLSVLLALGSASTTQAQSNAPLSIELRGRPASVRSDGVISFKVRLSNTHQHRRVALRGEPGFAATGGLELVITDSKGERRTAPATPGILTLDEAREGHRRVELEPGRTLGLSRVERVSALFPVPGRYRVLVSYRSLSPASGNRSVSPAALEGSEAISNTVDIDVVN